MKKAKSILFRAKLKGYGIVNYDGSEQKSIWNANSNGTNRKFCKHDNTIFAKKQWMLNDDGTTDYKISISTDCLKHEIFKDEMEFQSPNIMHHKSLLLNALASPVALLRGYMYVIKDEPSLKRSGAITLLDAIQTNNSISTIETFAKSGAKTIDENLSDNTLFFKETIGDIEYQTRGSIDLMKLQFLSTDDTFDRLGLDPDLFQEYLKILSTRMPATGELGYYKIKNSIIDIPEYGFVLSNENIVFLTKLFLKKLLNLSIKKSRAYADVVDVEYKIIYNPFTDKMDDENGWTKLTHDNIDSFSFETEDFYLPVNYDEAFNLRKEINIKMKEIKSKTKEAKEKDDQKKGKKKLVEVPESN